MSNNKIFDIFKNCVEAIHQGMLIKLVSRTDKEFHFQNWFQERIDSMNIFYDKGGRNTYPDFTLVKYTEGYEFKGLAYPGRESTYDCNSQVPTGYHNGRGIYYVFGRYPKTDDAGKEYPVIDLVICHGDFLNADHDYLHKNKNVKGFGCYGDIMIRDRKMYVAPTPYAIVDGLSGTKTLIVPKSLTAPSGFNIVGEIVRKEAKHIVIGYQFDLRKNEISASKVKNPHAGKQHRFTAYRLNKDATKPVILA